ARAVRMTLDAAEARLRVINAVGATHHWTVRLDGGTSELQAKYQLRNFSRTWEFLNEVAQVAHEMQHHPTITTTYNRVDIVLTTHDEANNVTERDTELAAEI
ncbi:transcriptional coactivator/pterin dehydratase, partial [Metschnikowia bicuspidata]